MSQWDDRRDDEPRNDGGWAAPGSGTSPISGQGYGAGSATPGHGAGAPGQGYAPGPYDAVAPTGARPSGGFSRIGPGGVPELWPGPIPLRPMSFGEILEAAFRVLRFNPKTLFGLTFVVLAVTLLVSTLVVFAVLAALGGASSLFTMSEDGDFAGGFGIQLASAALGLVGFFLSGMLIVPIAESALGRRLGAGPSWQRVKGRILPLLGYMVLSTLISLGVAMPLIVAVVVAAVADNMTLLGVVVLLLGPLTIAAYVWLTVKMCLAPAAIVLEQVGPIEGLRRSWRLTSGAFWRTLGVLFVVNLVAGIVVNILMMIFMMLVVGVTLALMSQSESAAAVIMIIGMSVIMLFSYTISLPLSASAYSVIYLDRRFRTEALAVDLLAEAERDRSAR